jgi:hypothetical protein
MPPTIPERAHLSRRDWINRVLQAAGGSIVTGPLLAQEHAHGTGQGSTQVAAWHPVFLTSSQNEALIAIGEGIIPGSKEALCNRVIDLILSIDSEKNRRQFATALLAFDSASQQQFNKPVNTLAAEQMNKLLERASTNANLLWPHFELLKEWLADSYWSSQQGLRELGWTGRMVWAKFDGCPHPGNHA